MQKQTYYALVALLALVVGALALTNQSLWIDEGSAALKAMEPSLGGWWHNLRGEGNSNLQLIGELLYLWGWAKIFGASEVALRASNIPFFVGGVVALAWGMGKDRRLQIATTFLALTNAFLWYYLSEARPYIFLFAFASLTAACLLRLIEETATTLASPGWFRLFCFGIVGLCLTSLIAVPWALGAMAAFVFWDRAGAARLALRCKFTSGLTLAALGSLACYYLWTLQLGARASDVGRTGWSNLCFIFYEQLGLAGLGPGRLTLRAEGAAAVGHFLPWIIMGGLAVLILGLAGFLTLRKHLTFRLAVFFTFAVMAPFVAVFAAGAMEHMRLLGRHLTPLLPYLLAWMGVGLAALLWGMLWQRALAAWLLLVLLFSAVQIRRAPRHRRDDYRGAAALARATADSGHRVWWLADVATGRYYHVPLDSPQVTASPKIGLPNDTPVVVILSKPDIYDYSGKARTYLEANGFKVARVLPAFQIWRRPPPR